MSTRRKGLLAVIMVPLAVLLTFASISIASAHPAGHLATHQVAKKKPTITISSFTFTVPKKVKPGAKIKVVNKDAAAHTVTSDDGSSFDVNVPGNSTVTFKAPKATGKYAFHCTFHGSMMGTLVVK